MPRHIAILRQALPPPPINGIVKPMKPGGYKDSCADIAFALSNLPQKWHVHTPSPTPDPTNDLDWSYPDTPEGINQAMNAGASILWANTILFSGHPLQQICKANKTGIVGQRPENVQVYDDKDETNRLLQKKGLTVPQSFTVTELNEEENEGEKIFALQQFTEKKLLDLGIEFPVIVKPIRGRGSQGVRKIDSYRDMIAFTREIFSCKEYGNKVLAEEFLSGEEFTFAVFPPGTYDITGEKTTKKYWASPAVVRVNHMDGVAPYNGVVAVTKNSFLWSENTSKVPKKEVEKMARECEVAAEIVGARAPIRIDCRMSKRGKGALFDLNMKPNMTGAGRPNRDDQDSLVGISVAGLGWSFSQLVDNIASNFWHYED